MNAQDKADLLAAIQDEATSWYKGILRENDAPDWTPPEKGYYDPTDISDLLTQNRVVRLDVVIMAMHIIAARTAVKSIPEVAKRTLDGVVTGVFTKLFFALAKQVLNEVFVGFAQACDTLWQLCSAAYQQQAAEKAIRKVSSVSINEVFQKKLSNAENANREKRLVASRHKQKKQRYRNGKRHKHYPVGVKWH